jgi:hypothetical protein
MQLLVLVMFLSVSVATFLTEVHLVPGVVKFLPEALSVVAFLAVLLIGPRERFRFIPAKYWAVFGALGTVLACGAIVNHVAPGTLIGGMRNYLRAIPFFFIPVVFEFSETQIRTQLRVLLALALLQLPISLYQRYEVAAHGHWSGDPVSGTLIISSIMSLFLIGATCIAVALTLQGRLRVKSFLVLFVLLIIPTTINETKSTVLLLPLGLLTSLLVGSPRGKRLRVGLSACALLALFGALYIPIYDHFAAANNPYPYTIENFFSDPHAVGRYVDQGTDLGSRKEAGRWDSLVVPLQAFASDPVHLLVGVGVGNGSASAFGIGYTGQYYGLFGRYTIETSGAAFIVEIGVLGLALVLILYSLVLRDAYAVATGEQTLVGALALGWLGVTVVIAVATFYKSLHFFESLSYLYWYFAGLVAAERVRIGSRALRQVVMHRGLVLTRTKLRDEPDTPPRRVRQRRAL